MPLEERVISHQHFEDELHQRLLQARKLIKGYSSLMEQYEMALRKVGEEGGEVITYIQNGHLHYKIMRKDENKDLV
jgi:hypothetical protein